MSNLSPKFTPTSYAAALDILGASRDKSRVVLCYATELTNGTGAGPTIRHHGTDIVTFLPDGYIYLFANGWASRTTADRMHRFTPHNVRVSSAGSTLTVTVDNVVVGQAEYGLSIRP